LRMGFSFIGFIPFWSPLHRFSVPLRTDAYGVLTDP
jgi:hypothetical protein